MPDIILLLALLCRGSGILTLGRPFQAGIERSPTPDASRHRRLTNNPYRIGTLYPWGDPGTRSYEG